MTPLSRFEVVRYRGINGLSLPSLSRANLVTGVNGVGKTALLEALWLFIGRYNPALLWNANVNRSSHRILDPVASLSGSVLELHGVENGKPHELKTVFRHISAIASPVTIGDTTGESPTQLPVVGRIDTYLDGKLAEGNIGGMQPTHRGLVAHENPVSLAGRPNCVIENTKMQLEVSDEYLQRYSDIVRENRKQELTNAINLIFPKITGIEILTDKAGSSYLSAMTTDGKQLPLHDLGGGVVRLSRLLLDFSASKDGILLADEVENGLHHTVLGEVWSRARVWMREWNVQLVATTHSAECIEAAMAAFADTPEDLSIHKLFVNGETGKIEVATFTGETLEGARDLNLEVR